MRSLTRKSTVRPAVLLIGASAFVLAAQQTGCSSGDPSNPISATAGPSTGGVVDSTGTVSLALTLPGGETVNSINWVLTGPDNATTVVQKGSVNLQNSETAGFLVSTVPAGVNYGIALSGTSVDGTTSCSGSTVFSVSSQMTTAVDVFLQCNMVAAATGAIAVEAQPYNCAAWSSLSVIPSEIVVGNSVTLVGGAIGANAAALGYAWSAPSGSFSAPTSASTNFTCMTAGVVTVTLTVSDGPVPDGGSCDPLTSTTTAQVICDPPLDASAPPADGAADGGDASNG
jgi:hypothetical protein